MKLNKIELRTEDYANIYLMTFIFDLLDPATGTLKPSVTQIREQMLIHNSHEPGIVANDLRKLADKLETYQKIFNAGKLEGR